MLFFVWVTWHALVSSLVEAVQLAASSSVSLERKGDDSQAQLPDRFFHDVWKKTEAVSTVGLEMAVIYRLMVLQNCTCSTPLAFSSLFAFFSFPFTLAVPH